MGHHHQGVRGWARGVVRYVGQLLKGSGLWAEDAVEEESLSGTILSEEKAFFARCGEPRRLRRSASDGVVSCGA